MLEARGNEFTEMVEKKLLELVEKQQAVAYEKALAAAESKFAGMIAELNTRIDSNGAHASCNGACSVGVAAGGKCGGKCDGKCNDCRYTRVVRDHGHISRHIYDNYLKVISGRDSCYHQCIDDPELEAAWVAMGAEFGCPRMSGVLSLDDDVVPTTNNVGSVADPADFINFPTAPLAANQKALIRTISGQVGPFRAGCVKVAVDWNGEPANTAATLTYYIGPRDLSDVSLAELQTGGSFVQWGKPKKLSLYYCGADKCFLVPAPTWRGCTAPVITYKEAIYVLIEVGAAAGASTIKAIDVTFLKVGTQECGRALKCCGD